MIEDQVPNKSRSGVDKGDRGVFLTQAIARDVIVKTSSISGIFEGIAEQSFNNRNNKNKNKTNNKI